MSGLPWLRLYKEIIDDEKTGTLNDSEFRLFIEILCIIPENNDGVTLKFMSWRLRKDIKKEIKELIKRGLIIEDSMQDGETLFFVNGWEKRQFPSDSSSERTKRYRQRLKKCDGNETSQERHKERDSDAIDKNRTEQNRTEEELTKVNSMSGKPDVAPLKSQNIEIKNQAIEVLNFLNEKTGRIFRPVDTNLKLIIARLRSGATPQDCKSVIAKKRRDWIGDEKMISYLRPATLFNATKFEQYLGELIPEGEI